MDSHTSTNVDVDVDVDVEEEALLPGDERLTYASFRKHANLNELLHIYGLHKNQPVSATIIAAWQWRSFRAAQKLEPLPESANLEVERKGPAKPPEVERKGSAKPPEVERKGSAKSPEGERKDSKSPVVAPEEGLKLPTIGPEFPEGEGRVYLGLSIYYTGGFRKGFLHGKGTLTWGEDHRIGYDGEFFYNCLHGVGTYQWPGISDFSGEIFDGLPSGQARMIEGKRGHIYEGRWAAGLRHGQGTMNFNPGSEEDPVFYAGAWAHDQKHGHGQYVYATTTTYQGLWKEGKQHGIGIQVQYVDAKTAPPDNPTIVASVYEGEWANNVPHGRGKHLWTWDHAKETIGLLHNAYVGGFETGMRSGKGTFYFASCGVFQGIWKKNLKNGFGVFTYEDGRICSGIYKDNHFDPIPDKSIGVLVKETLDEVLQDEEDPHRAKVKVSYILMRYLATLKTLFHEYSAHNTDSSKSKLELPEAGPELDANQEEIQSVDSVPKPTPPKAPNPAQDSLKKIKALQRIKRYKSLFELPEKQLSKEYINQLATNMSGSKQEGPPIPGSLDKKFVFVYQNLRLEGQTYAMTIDSFWRLCHNFHVVEPGLGLAQIDAILSPASNAWDDIFDLYCPTRQLIQREVNVALIKLGLCKFYAQEIGPDDELLKFFEICKNTTPAVDVQNIFTIVANESVQDILLKYKVVFQRLFSMSMLRSKTQSYCIKLREMVHLLKTLVFGSEVPEDDLLKVILRTIYQFETRGENQALYLDMEINFKEFEMLMVQFSTTEIAPKITLDEGNPHRGNGELVQAFMSDIVRSLNQGVVEDDVEENVEP